MRCKQYTVTEKDFSSAKLLTPPDSVLSRLNRPKEANFPDAPYWWPLAHTRFHACKLFTPRAKVIRAEAAFLCDNLFDLWLDGQQFAFDIRCIMTSIAIAQMARLKIEHTDEQRDEHAIVIALAYIRVHRFHNMVRLCSVGSDIAEECSADGHDQ